MVRFALAAAAAVMASSASAATFTFTFDDGTYTIFDQTDDYTEYLINGVRFITSGVIEDGVVKSTLNRNGESFFALGTYPGTPPYPPYDIVSFDLRGPGNITFSPDGSDLTTLTATADFSTFGPYLNSTGTFFLNGGSQPFQIDNVVLDIVTAPIPEPASWAMMIAGFGLAGAAARLSRPSRVLA